MAGCPAEIEAMIMPDLEPSKTLAEALMTLQGQLPRVAKTNDAQVGPRTYKYADLTDVSEALLPLLASVGLSFTARPTLAGEGRFVLLYTLMHTSGDEISGEYPLPASGSPQQIGSAITYARRYSLCAVTGLAPGGDDDDGQASEQAHQALPRTGTNAELREQGRMDRRQKAEHERLAADTQRSARAERSHPRGPDPDDPWAQDPPGNQWAAGIRAEAEDRPGSSNPKQHQQLGILYQQLGITERETRLTEMTDRMGRTITSAKDLSYAEAEQAIRDLRDLAAKEGAP